MCFVRRYPATEERCALGLLDLDDIRCRGAAEARGPPSPRTNRTRRVPHPVPIGHAAAGKCTCRASAMVPAARARGARRAGAMARRGAPTRQTRGLRGARVLRRGRAGAAPLRDTREGGRECTVGTRVGATVGRGGERVLRRGRGAEPLAGDRRHWTPRSGGASGATFAHSASSSPARAGSTLPPPSRTKWTRRVPHPVPIGHAASLGRFDGLLRASCALEVGCSSPASLHRAPDVSA